MKIIKFEQNACNPCTILGNILKYEFGVEVDETVNLSTDGDVALELAGMYGVMKTPTMILIDDMGVVVKRFSGTDKEDITDILTQRGLI